MYEINNMKLRYTLIGVLCFSINIVLQAQQQAIMPGGKKYYIAVFVTGSSETDEENAAIIAHISRMVYDEMK